MKIFLIGFMGAGKTSKGRKLARRLGFGFIDMDDLIEEQEGMTVSQLFASKGEEWFRSKETDVLHELGERTEDLVIATGGGAPCFNNNMDYINSVGTSVYLKLSPLGLVVRLTKSKKPVRPLLEGKSEKELFEFISLKLQEREPFYMKSVIVVPADFLKTKELVSYLPFY